MMWEINPKISIGPIYLGMTEDEYTSVLGRKDEVFRRFEGDDDEVIAYDDIGVHITVDPDKKVKHISVFQPNNVYWENVQLLGRDIKAVSGDLQSKGVKNQPVDVGIWNEDGDILLVEVDGLVDGVEMGQ
ncbi:MAG: hypothetical protein ACLFQY_17225 [Desulfococcaceae bacterium]